MNLPFFIKETDKKAKEIRKKNYGQKIKIVTFPDEETAFCGLYVKEPCMCCGTDNDTYIMHINDNRTILCSNCLNTLYEKSGHILHKSVKLNDKVWELTKCDDKWQIFPMVVKDVSTYGSVRWIKGKKPVICNIYAESDDTYMYKNFYDTGKTLFFSEEEANAALESIYKK